MMTDSGRDRGTGHRQGPKALPGVGLSALPEASVGAEHGRMANEEAGNATGSGGARTGRVPALARFRRGGPGRGHDRRPPRRAPGEFVVSGGAIVFRTVPGTKLDAATAGAVVAFEADAYGTAEDRSGWSVLVRGVAEEVTRSRPSSRPPASSRSSRGPGTVAPTGSCGSSPPSSPVGASARRIRPADRASAVARRGRLTAYEAGRRLEARVVVRVCAVREGRRS